MGRPKTLEHQLEQAKADIEELKNIIGILSKEWPSYIHSFTGAPIVMIWCRYKGLTWSDMRMIVYIRNNRTLAYKDLPCYGISQTQYNVARRIDALIAKGYIQLVEQPSLSSRNIYRRRAYVLTPKGSELEQEYRDYYERHMAAARAAEQKKEQLKQKYAASGIKQSKAGRPYKVY